MSSMIFGLCRVVKLLLLLFEADEGVFGYSMYVSLRKVTID